MEALENQLKEARFLAEEADRKYDEVSISFFFLKKTLDARIFFNPEPHFNSSVFFCDSNLPRFPLISFPNDAGYFASVPLWMFVTFCLV